MAENDPGEAAPGGSGLKISQAAGQAVLALIALGAVAIVAYMTWRSLNAGGDALGVASSAFLGFLMAVGFIGVGGGLLAWFGTRHGPITDPPAPSSDLTRALALLLAEMEAVRTRTRGHIHVRMLWMTPVGGLAGYGLARLGQLAVGSADQYGEGPKTLAGFAGSLLGSFASGLVGESGDWFKMVMFGAAAGYFIAAWAPSRAYGRLFKARVLPVLAARFGALTYRLAPAPDLERLRRFHVFRHFTRARADDQILGQYRGLRISVTQLDLSRRYGLRRREVFHGLLAEVTLKNRLLGVTAITADAGALGNLVDELASHGFRRASLEDPLFEKDYQVYATDQVMARALITPEFMQRFRALEHRRGFGRPLALAQDDVLLLALPRPGDVYSPPGYRTSAADARVLQALMEDIETVLHAADSVIELDDATREAAGKAQTQ